MPSWLSAPPLFYSVDVIHLGFRDSRSIYKEISEVAELQYYNKGRPRGVHQGI
jgi:hypothetical protein